ncbi:type II secretion system protein [Candidatus Beckwithbacteria bacterium]|nr:type II secretion system protein [Candidatus Beckwithbacteria bacterium]
MIRKQNGFTLIETLVVVGLFTMTIGGAITLFMMMIKGSQKSDNLLRLNQTSVNILEIFNRELIAAQRINNCDAIAENIPEASKPTYLSFTNKDNQDFNFGCVFPDDGSNGDIIFGETHLLDPEYKFTLQSCSFSCYKNNSGIPVGVSFEFTLSSLENTKNNSTYVSLRRNNL